MMSSCKDKCVLVIFIKFSSETDIITSYSKKS